MIERTIISVDGPPGSGKTTFVEHYLRAAGRCVQAVRCHREPTRRAPRESSPRGHPELKRYRLAGADAATVYRFPEPEPDAFYCSNFMMDPTDVVIEGERPIPYADLDVFVALAPEPRKKLLHRVKRNLARERRATQTRLRALLESPDGMARVVGELLGTPFAMLAQNRPETMEPFRAVLQAHVDSIGSTDSSPRSTERWEIAESYHGVERAQLVVINIRGDAERSRGERALEDVLRLRSDPVVFEDVFRWRGSRVPITAVVADLSNERDAGLRKAIRRALRTGDAMRGDGS